MTTPEEQVILPEDTPTQLGWLRGDTHHLSFDPEDDMQLPSSSVGASVASGSSSSAVANLPTLDPLPTRTRSGRVVKAPHVFGKT